MNIFKRRLLLIAIVGYFCSCNSSSNMREPNTNRQATHDELKQELKESEQINPTTYLSLKAQMSENITQKADLFHHTKRDGYIFSGSINNSSTVAKFKDVIVTVTYYSETQSVIESHEYVMYKYFNPSSETPFEYKVNPPENFKNFGAVIKTATPVN